MKLLVAWLFLIALALVAAGSCSIKHSSEQFDCDTNADCADLDGNRVCSEGLCVVPGGNMKDAAPGDVIRIDAPVDAALVCPPQCTSCNLGKKECLVDCQADSDPATCANQIVCPPGFSCIVKCNTPGSCRNGVTCTASTACAVECTAGFSCRNMTTGGLGVSCGAGPCLVTCSGGSSCQNVACNQSCACDVKCAAGVASCFNVTCTKQVCDTGLGCSSEPQTCDTCP